MANRYDLIVIGAGSGGITAAQFAARLGVNVALVEKHKIGGDCTWSGCVPSKALLKAAKMARAAQTAAEYGVCLGGSPPRVDMAGVRNYVHQAIAQVYQHETPDQLAGEGIQVISGLAQFLDAHTIQVGEQTLSAKKFIIATGAHPFIPPISGIENIPYLTYLNLFENDRLPARFLVVGAGPVGVEIAQAYQRLGSQVTLIDIGLLPREEPEVAEVVGRVFAQEGLQFVKGLVTSARQAGADIMLEVEGQEYSGDMLLMAVGRTANLAGLNLEKAGVEFSDEGIPVDEKLRTNVKHIYAAGDCVAGNYQFTHFAGWQAYVATRNALLPGNDKGFTQVMPWTIFTEPEVAHVGLTEKEARQQMGDAVQVSRRDLSLVDRAVTDDDREGFVKVVHQKNGKILGATIVAGRAGEMITEYALALQQGLKMFDLANLIHAYPTYSMATMRLAAETETERIMAGLLGKALRFLAGRG